MAQFKTVGAVVNRAVELAQLDSSFLPLARQYYNLALNQTVGEFDWSYFRVETSSIPFIGGQVAYDLPLDYNRSDTCYLADSNNNRRPITIISKYRFDRLKSNGSYNGDPTIAYIDLTNQKIVFNASPTASRFYILTYFRMPDEIDDQGGDDSNQIDFENALFLIYYIVSMLMDYNDDERAPMMMQKADKLLRDDKMNQADEDNDPRIELGPSFRAGRRSNNGGGWNFF